MKLRTMLVLAVLAAAPAGAVPFKAGSTKVTLPTGTTAAADPTLKGTVVLDQMAPFKSASGAPPVTGTLQVRTVRVASGKLDFYWRVLNASGSGGAIKSLFLTGFSDAATNIDWRADGLGTVAPATADRFFGKPDGWVLSFQFATAIKPGQSSRFIFMKTSSTISKPQHAHAYMFTTGSMVPPFWIEGQGN